MPRKKPVRIKRVKKHSLLDDRLIYGSKNKFATQVLITIAVILLIALAVFAYLVFFSQNQALAPTVTSEDIIVPEVEQTADAGSPPVAEEEAVPEVILPQLLILDTPTGWLNVRRGPGTNFEQFTRVNPGESYELLSEDREAGWYEIRLDEERTGWVSGRYTERE